MHVTQIYRYPLKSGAAETCSQAVIEARGLAGDRTWMVVDPNGTFVTARKHPRLVLIRTTHTGLGRCLLEAPDLPAIEACADRGRPMRVTVWNEPCSAWGVQDEVNQWLSDYLGIECRLVHLPPSLTRPIAADTGIKGAQVSFADGFPLLLISEASLADLNQRLEQAIGMDRFRPNIVVDGHAPFVEDTWHRIRIGEAEFTCYSPCSRCVLTTVDSHTGTVDKSGEPLRTLATYRRQEGGVMFGMNLIPTTLGNISRGASIHVIERRAAPQIMGP